MNDCYKRAKELFLQVCDLSLEERSRILDRECAGDPELRREVESLIEHHDAAHDPAEVATAATGSRQAPSHPTRIGPYRVHHEVGRGGMGVVYLAIRDDDQFKRRVALKVLKRGMDTDDVLRRFELERQLLAAMNHPNIARLYDGGQTDDGRPFFAMEYVEGLPLDEYCDVHRLHIDERLELFRTVCSAVHYAHQNLVVHRDLKPGNILVGKDGVPKLLDFGIAKLVNPEFSMIHGDPTLPEFRVMTPEYASPEQVRGNPITTSSDIYSLGVVLYELVSGHRPYHIKSRVRAELERIICDEEPDKPSTAISKVEQVGDERSSKPASTKTVTPESVSRSRESGPSRLRRRLSGDIDNIVMMAMRKEPLRRYKSAEKLSEDLRRHLTGMTVIAHRDTLRYRTWKFVKRNRGPVAVAAVIVLLLLGGIISTMIQRAEAIKQWRVAEAERTAAQAERDNFKDLYSAALVALDKSSGEFTKSIQDLVNATTARETLLTVADRFYEALVQTTGDRSALRDFRARVLEQKGMLLGSLRGPSFRLPSMALISFDEALPLREALVADSPNDPKTLSNLAWCLIRKGDVLQMLSRNEEAASQYTRVMAVLGPPMNSAQIDPDVAKYYSMAVVSRADVLIEQKKPDEALEIYSRELDRREAVAREHPGDANALRDASNIAVRISEWLRTSNKPKEALQYSERALTLRLQRLAIDPDSDRGKRDVATGHRYVALCLLDDQQASAAVEQLEKGLGIAQKLWKSAAAEDAGEARSPMTVAVILETLGLALRQEGKPHEAVNRHLEAIAVIEPFADPARDDVDSQRILAYLQYHVGKTQFEFLNDSEGLDQLRASRATLQHLTDTGTSKDGDRQFLDDIEAILSRQSSSSQ